MTCGYVLIRITGDVDDAAEFLKTKLGLETEASQTAPDVERHGHYKDCNYIMRYMTSFRGMIFEEAIERLKEAEYW